MVVRPCSIQDTPLMRSARHFWLCGLPLRAGDERSGASGSQRKKRGPQSQLETQMAAIASLPRKEQQQLLAVVEAFISQHASR